MDFDLYFCADGILRAKLGNDKPMIPVKFLQDNGVNKENDFRFWARWWESTAYFESGLTVSKFLSCLEPWGEFWSDFTGKDVIAYIKESRRPIAISDKKDDEKPLDWVCISYYTDASPVSEYSDKEDLEDMFEDINEWLNKPKNTRLTGQWDIHSSYKVTGFVKDQEEQYSIDYSPLNKLANLPIILNNKHVFTFCNWKLNQILGSDKEHFFQENAFGLCSMSEGFTRFIIGEKSHTMRDIVEGFFWWFHSNPTRRNEFVESILKRKDEINEAIEASLEDEDMEDKPSNVVSLFTNDDESVITPKENDSKVRKVSIASNAFSPLIMSMERDKSYWEEMLEKAYRDKNVILKIGQIEEAKAPEKRVFSHIIKDENDPANPKPSEYKLW